jgi:hypothetical protein
LPRLPQIFSGRFHPFQLVEEGFDFFQSRCRFVHCLGCNPSVWLFLGFSHHVQRFRKRLTA